MSINRTFAITCRCRSYSETSQTVLFFTRDYGMVRGLAKGVLRPQNAFGGPFDTLSEYEIFFIRKNGSSLHTITAADLVHSFPGIRQGLDRYTGSNLLLEVVLGLAADGEANRALYGLFRDCLKVLESGGNRAPIVMGFALQALRLAGLGLKFNECSQCGKKEAGTGRQSFDPSEGGLLCAKCRGKADEAPRRPRNSMIQVRAGDLRVLTALASSDPERLSKINPGPDVRKGTAKIVSHALRFVLENPPVMLKYML
ncbi:MAG: DNA repair protein RecO [Planctomycetota bacterium]|jgi:DNA repair protein RecO (recombination protein O)